VMGMNIFGLAASFARTFLYLSITDRVVDHVCCAIFVWILPPIFPNVLQALSVPAFSIISPVIIDAFVSVFQNSRASTRFAFVYSAICHIWVFVKFAQWLFLLALKAFLHVRP